MVQTVTEPVFAGSTDEQTLARELTQVMRFAGRMYGTNIAIRQPLSALVEYATARGFATGSDAAALVETAVRANPAIFAVETEEGETYVVTTKDGTTPHLVAEGMSHQFRTRLTEPEPTRAVIETPHVRAEREYINDNWYKEIIVPEGATEGETDEEDETGEEATAPFAEIAALAAAHQSAVVETPLDYRRLPARRSRRDRRRGSGSRGGRNRPRHPGGQPRHRARRRRPLRLLWAGILPARSAHLVRTQRQPPHPRIPRGAPRAAIRRGYPARCTQHAPQRSRVRDCTLFAQPHLSGNPTSTLSAPPSAACGASKG